MWISEQETEWWYRTWSWKSSMYCTTKLYQYHVICPLQKLSLSKKWLDVIGSVAVFANVGELLVLVLPDIVSTDLLTLSDTSVSAVGAGDSGSTKVIRLFLCITTTREMRCFPVALAFSLFVLIAELFLELKDQRVDAGMLKETSWLFILGSFEAASSSAALLRSMRYSWRNLQWFRSRREGELWCVVNSYTFVSTSQIQIIICDVISFLASACVNLSRTLRFSYDRLHTLPTEKEKYSEKRRWRNARLHDEPYLCVCS